MEIFYITLFAFLLAFTTKAQSYLGKTKDQILEEAIQAYDEVEFIDQKKSEEGNLFSLKCDNEVNQFFMLNDICIKFTAQKSYQCKCLADDVKAYNASLDSNGNLKWTSKDGARKYEIILEKDHYSISIVQNNQNIVGLSSK